MRLLLQNVKGLTFLGHTVLLTDKAVSDVGDVSAGKQIVDDPVFLCLQEVHHVFYGRPVSCNHITHDSRVHSAAVPRPVIGLLIAIPHPPGHRPLGRD